MPDNKLKKLFDGVTDWAVAFRTGLADMSTVPRKSYAQSLADFSAPVPESGEDWGAILEELETKSKGAMLMQTSPRFFGWVMGATHPVGVAAEFFTAASGQMAAHPGATPANSAIETVTERWILDLLDLPRQSSIGFVSGATIANFTCLVAASGEVLRRVGWDANADGLFGAPPITVLIGEDAHSTVFMALQYAGLGHRRVVRVATDSQGRMRPDAFATEIAKVKGPAIVILQAGQINTGDFDPFAEIVPMAKAAGAWVHVDGAFGLWARAAKSLKHLTAGIELGRTHGPPTATNGCRRPMIAASPSSRMNWPTAAPCRLPRAICRRPRRASACPFNYVPELSRRARGNSTWAVIKALGRAGIAEMVERHCRVARQMAERLAAEPGVAVVNDVVINQVAVRFGTDLGDAESDRLTTATIARIQDDGVCFAGGAEWHGHQIMRISVTSRETSEEDGRRSAEAMLDGLSQRAPAGVITHQALVSRQSNSH